MKTARERAEEFLLKMAIADWSWEEMMVKTTELIEEHEADIKNEQNNITRHACAEATLDCSEYCEHPNGNMALDPNEVHAACMNVKAV